MSPTSVFVQSVDKLLSAIVGAEPSLDAEPEIPLPAEMVAT